jgi:RNA polymerase sigma-70 factor (ECF subfamily)
MVDVTDEELMEAYRQGDNRAFEQLFARYAPRLGRSLRRRVRNTADADELLQQTFLHLHRARHDFRSGTRLRPWLFTICRNLEREYFRKRMRRPESPLELDGRSDPRQECYDPVRTERMKQVRAALERLPLAQREVIELHWLEDLPFKEVSAIVGASVTAVKVRAHRGYERLRVTLAVES